MSSKKSDAEQLTWRWLENAVIGLGLCPFASKPLLEKRIRIQVFTGKSELDLLSTLHAELLLLDQQPASELETTLLVITGLLSDFDDFNQFLNQVDALLEHFAWEGKYQVASFHPQYCFADTAPEAAENLTNRSPYPLLHIIREDSLAEALEHFSEPEKIPVQNIKRMNSLSESDKRQIFPWLFS